MTWRQAVASIRVRVRLRVGVRVRERTRVWSHSTCDAAGGPAIMAGGGAGVRGMARFMVGYIYS